MPNVEISMPTFTRLQKYATPLVDTAETVLLKVLDLADSAIKSDTKTPTQLSSDSVPDLTHTTLKSASIDGKALSLSGCNWNALMMAVIEKAATQLPLGSKISDLIIVNHVDSEKADNGYKFLKAVGVSVQGQNSNNAWRAITQLAKATGVKVEASFVWANHPKAAKPGQAGHLLT
jgi:hypothetical protein